MKEIIMLYNIDWDVDEEEDLNCLPNGVLITNPSAEMLEQIRNPGSYEDIFSDYLSDNYEFCIKDGFDIDVISLPGELTDQMWKQVEPVKKKEKNYAFLADIHGYCIEAEADYWFDINHEQHFGIRLFTSSGVETWMRFEADKKDFQFAMENQLFNFQYAIEI